MNKEAFSKPFSIGPSMGPSAYIKCQKLVWPVLDWLPAAFRGGFPIFEA
jgi:hypothetical protein